jgi:ATP-binding cassette subfamily B protein
MFHDPRHLFEAETSKPQDVSQTLRRFAGYFRPYWRRYLGVLVMMIVSTWAAVTAPQLLGQAVDCYLVGPAATAAFEGVAPTLSAQPPGAGGPPVQATNSACWYADVPLTATTEERIVGLAGLVLRLLALYAIGSVTTGLMFYWMTTSGQRVLRTLRVDVFHHILRLPIGYHVAHESGDIMSRVTNDADTIQQAVSFALIQVLSGAFLIAWVAYKMLSESVAYGLVALTMLPLMVLATAWFSAQARKAFRRTRVRMGSVNAELQESISGVREAQAFSREDENIASFRETNAANRDANIRAVAYTSALAPTLEALGYVALALVAIVGGYALLQGQTLLGETVTLGLMITFIAYVQRFNQPVQQIAVLWTNIQSAVAGGERIFGLLDVVPDLQDAPQAIDLPPIRGEVVLDDVWAEYQQGEAVLRGVSLRAAPGETVAIVGPTGAGKTTLISLIPRFYDVTGGVLTIDGHDVRQVTGSSLRRQIGVVLQESFLFSDTVMENIRFGRPGATADEVIAAARLANADRFIERLPEGYQTLLGERGSGLSQGQRQLVAIARAALADPRILILDEATSSVDTRTERLIQGALETLLRDRTSFVIAHRLSTIRHADQVLFLNQGRIAERGTHESLMAQRGMYYDLYMSQFRRQAPAESVRDAPTQAAEGRLSPAGG